MDSRYTSVPPKVSVIMGIYNCAETLDEALQSILSQTMNDWEVVMCDDGSKDNTFEIALKYVKQYPNRFVLLRNEQNIGLNDTLNRCLQKSRGEYIARMDGDDISIPERFEKECKVLDTNSQFDIVSTDMTLFDEKGVYGKTNRKEYPQPSDLVHGTIFCHAPCMVRRSAYEKVNGYSSGERLLRVEDYHLWVKMYAQGIRGCNLKECLYMMRDDRNARNRRLFKYRINESYVRAYAVRSLHLPVYLYVYTIIPILIGLLPTSIYTILHRIKHK